MILTVSIICAGGGGPWEKLVLASSELAMVGKVHLAGVSGDQSIEPRGLAFFWSQDPTEPLSFLLA